MPPIKIYETLQQSNATDAYKMNQDGTAEKLNRDELDFFRKDEDISKKEGQSVGGAGSVTEKGSP